MADESSFIQGSEEFLRSVDALRDAADISIEALERLEEALEDNRRLRNELRKRKEEVEELRFALGDSKYKSNLHDRLTGENESLKRELRTTRDGKADAQARYEAELLRRERMEKKLAGAQKVEFDRESAFRNQAELESEVEKFKRQLENLREELQEKSTVLAGATEERDRLFADAKKQGEDLHALSRDLRQATGWLEEMRTARSSLESECERLKGRLAGAMEREASAHEKYRQVFEERNRLADENEELKKEFKYSKESLAKREKRIDELKRTMESIQVDEVLIRREAELNEKYTLLLGEHGNAKSELEEKRRELERKDTQLAARDEHIAEITQTLETLRSVEKSSSAHGEELEEKYKEAVAERERITTEVRESEREIEKLGRRLEEKDEQIEKMKREMEELKSEKTATVEQRNESKEELVALTAEGEKIAQELEEKNRETEQLRGEIKERDGMISELEKKTQLLEEKEVAKDAAGDDERVAALCGERDALENELNETRHRLDEQAKVVAARNERIAELSDLLSARGARVAELAERLEKYEGKKESDKDNSETGGGDAPGEEPGEFFD